MQRRVAPAWAPPGPHSARPADGRPDHDPHPFHSGWDRIADPFHASNAEMPAPKGSLSGPGSHRFVNWIVPTTVSAVVCVSFVSIESAIAPGSSPKIRR